MGIWVDGFSGFGLFTLLTNFIGYAGWKSKEAKENKKAFRRTYNPRKDTYLDMYCVERRPNGEYCKTERISNGDLVQRNKDNLIVRNFSQEERERESSLSDATVIRMSDENLVYSSLNEPTGIKYKDKHTGKIYVIRAFRVNVNKSESHCVYFYMNTSDATLERITDGEKRYGTLKNKDAINNFISKFNDEQKTKRFFLISEKYHEKNRRDTDRTSIKKI